MARVTVEDCIDKITNRFDLVLIAAQRARNIVAGDTIGNDRDKEKEPVIALREIADERIDTEMVNEGLIKSLQRIQVREEEQSAIDEEESISQDNMAAYYPQLRGNGAIDGMQIISGQRDDANNFINEFSHEGAIETED